MKLPLRMHRYDASFGIKDAAGTTICYVYFDKGNPGERAIRGLMSEEEAEPIAKQIARLLTDAETTKEAGQPRRTGRLVQQGGIKRRMGRAIAAQ